MPFWRIYEDRPTGLNARVGNAGEGEDRLSGDGLGGFWLPFLLSVGSLLLLATILVLVLFAVDGT